MFKIEKTIDDTIENWKNIKLPWMKIIVLNEEFYTR